MQSKQFRKFDLTVPTKLHTSNGTGLIDKGTAETSPHYNALGNEQPILIMLRTFTKEEFLGYLRGNVIKYKQRAGLKSGTNDRAKADQYHKWLVEYFTFDGISIGDKFYTAKE